MNRVVVTGLGALTAVGSGRQGLWAGIRRGESGIGPLTRFDPAPYHSRVAGEITDFDPLAHFDARRLKRLDRFAQFSLVAARMALLDAGGSAARPTAFLGGHPPFAQAGVSTGTALGGVCCAEDQHEVFLHRGLRAVNPALAFLVFGGSGGAHIAIEFGFTGPGTTNSNSCASGAIAIGEAFHLLRAGRATVMIAGAAEAPLSPLTFGAFDLIRAMSQANQEPARAGRAFDRNRDGFVMGEGAAMLVLEDREHARARGARILAEVLGYASTNDAFDMLQPRPDASCAARCIRTALADAGLPAARIGYINAHATGTPLGDRAEVLAIKEVFGDRAPAIPISGTKPYYGHPLGASGAIEAALCCLALTDNFLPPTLNLDQPEEESGLDFIPNTGRSARVDSILSNSFGFGGVNACLVLGRHE